jgi:membrane protein
MTRFDQSPYRGSLFWYVSRMSDGTRKMMQRLSKRVPRFLIDLASFLVYTARRFDADGLTLAAGALTFSTLLALVPLMVIAFAILSGFATFDPARERMEALFFDIFVPEVGAEVGNYLAEFSRNAANLTALGIIALGVTAVMLLWTIEATLNHIWRVEKPRSMGVRVLIYWTVLTLGPLLLGASFVLTSGTFTTLTQWAREGVGLEQTEQALPTLGAFFALLTQSLTFMLLFKIVPARPVRLRDAAVGGVIGGVGVQVLRWGFDYFLTRGSTYETVYGAVAILPIFLFWLYLSWIVVILGAVFAASLPDWWKTRDALPNQTHSPSRKLEVAVAVLSILARHARGGETVSQEQLQDMAPLDIRDELFGQMRASGYMIITEDDQVGLLRDLHITTVADLARDLELLLGVCMPGGIEPDLSSCRGPDATLASGALPRMLRKLHDAETAILSRSLNDVIFAVEITTAPADGGSLRSGPQPPHDPQADRDAPI